MTFEISHKTSLLAKLRGLRLSRIDGKLRLTWPTARVLQGDIYAGGGWVTKRNLDKETPLLEYRVLPGQTVGGRGEGSA
jgi:hypothetical protein